MTREELKKRAVKIVFYTSIVLAFAAAIAGGLLFNGPAPIGVFFGAILGFFAPWVVALLAYTFIALSDPRIMGLNNKKPKEK